MFADRNKIKLVKPSGRICSVRILRRQRCAPAPTFTSSAMMDFSTIAPFSDHAVLHDDQILDHGALLNHNSGTDNPEFVTSVDLQGTLR